MRRTLSASSIHAASRRLSHLPVAKSAGISHHRVEGRAFARWRKRDGLGMTCQSAVRAQPALECGSASYRLPLAPILKSLAGGDLRFWGGLRVLWLDKTVDLTPRGLRVLWLDKTVDLTPRGLRVLWLHKTVDLTPRGLRVLRLDKTADLTPRGLRVLWLDKTVDLTPRGLRVLWLHEAADLIPRGLRVLRLD